MSLSLVLYGPWVRRAGIHFLAIGIFFSENISLSLLFYWIYFGKYCQENSLCPFLPVSWWTNVSFFEIIITSAFLTFLGSYSENRTTAWPWSSQLPARVSLWSDTHWDYSQEQVHYIKMFWQSGANRIRLVKAHICIPPQRTSFLAGHSASSMNKTTKEKGGKQKVMVYWCQKKKNVFLKISSSKKVITPQQSFLSLLIIFLFKGEEWLNLNSGCPACSQHSRQLDLAKEKIPFRLIFLDVQLWPSKQRGQKLICSWGTSMMFLVGVL